MPLNSSVMRKKKFRCCEKKVKLLLEQLQVCIFVEIVFGVRCTLRKATFFLYCEELFMLIYIFLHARAGFLS